MSLNQGFEYGEQITSKNAGRTVLEHLARSYRHSSEKEWLERIEDGQVSLDGGQARPDAVLKSGQRLVWRRSPWSEPDVPLFYSVLYEDEELLAVEKPSGLPVMPAGGFLDNTLLALVRKRRPEAAPAHRLGRGTSGIVLFALTARARSFLCSALRQREVIKTYRALAEGAPAADSFSIDAPIGPIPHPLLETIFAASTGGKPAMSHVQVLERRQNDSILKVRIETGRPHQIRIHLATVGHPLVGDPLYAAGGGFKDSGSALPGDAGYLLHAELLRLRHPATGQIFEISSPPPQGLKSRVESGQ